LELILYCISFQFIDLVSLSSTSTSSGASVFQVSTTDPEGDFLTYSPMTIEPAGGPFTITAGEVIFDEEYFLR